MNKLSISIAALSAAFIGVLGTLLTLNGCGKASSSSTLAVVNGEEISTDEFHNYLEGKQTVRVITGNGTAEARVAESLAFQALQDMIGRQVTLQLAKDEGVYPTDQDITKELDFQRKLDPDFLTKLQRAGLTIDRVKQNILLSLAREKLLTKNVTVTMAEAEDFIRNNPKQFVNPATADLLWVFVKTNDKKAQVDEALKAGQTFSVVATQYSEIPGAKEQAGKFPQREISQMEPNLQKMINQAKEGQATGWLTLSDGAAKFFVEKKSPEKPMEMNNYQKELVRRNLAQQRGSQAIDLGKRVLDKLVKSKVDVKDKSLTEAWNRAFERYKQEQKVDVSSPVGQSKPSGTG